MRAINCAGFEPWDVSYTLRQERLWSIYVNDWNDGPGTQSLEVPHKIRTSRVKAL